MFIYYPYFIAAVPGTTSSDKRNRRQPNRPVSLPDSLCWLLHGRVPPTGKSFGPGSCGTTNRLFAATELCSVYRRDSCFYPVKPLAIEEKEIFKSPP